MNSITRVACAFTLFTLVACANDGHAPGGSEITFPEVTKAVSGSSFLGKVKSKAVSGAALNTSMCSNCGSSTGMAFAHSLASLFVLQGMIADNNSCSIVALEKSGVISGLTSGDFIYLYADNIRIKAKVKVEGGVVSLFEMNHCMDGVQVQHMAGTNSGGNVTFTFRSKDTGTFASMDASGTLSGETWTSKTVNFKFYNTTSLSNFTISQNSDYLDITGTIDSGTIGTLDGTDFRMVSRAQLLGSSAKTYALGDGSIRAATAAGAASNTNWNGDTGVHGAGPTTYDADVASATLPSVTSTYATDFTASETWDCSMPGGGIDFASAITGNETLMNDMIACSEDFQ